MSYKKLLVCMFCVITCKQGVNAQQRDSLKFLYDNHTIYRYGSMYMKGSEKLRFRDLRNEFDLSELGLMGYQKAKKYKTVSVVSSYISLFAGLGAVSAASGRIGNNTNYRGIAVGLYITQLVAIIVSGSYAALSARTLDRAIWQRNRDVLFPDR